MKVKSAPDLVGLLCKNPTVKKIKIKLPGGNQKIKIKNSRNPVSIEVPRNLGGMSEVKNPDVLIRSEIKEPRNSSVNWLA